MVLDRRVVMIPSNVFANEIAADNADYRASPRGRTDSWSGEALSPSRLLKLLLREQLPVRLILACFVEPAEVRFMSIDLGVGPQ